MADLLTRIQVWDDVESPLSAFLCAVIEKGLPPSAHRWSTEIAPHLRGIIQRPLSELDVPELMSIILGHLRADRRDDFLFHRFVLRKSFKARAYYVRGLRHKYAHHESVSGAEQLADLIILHSTVSDLHASMLGDSVAFVGFFDVLERWRRVLLDRTFEASQISVHAHVRDTEASDVIASAVVVPVKEEGAADSVDLSDSTIEDGATIREGVLGLQRETALPESNDDGQPPDELTVEVSRPVIKQAGAKRKRAKTKGKRVSRKRGATSARSIKAEKRPSTSRTTVKRTSSRTATGRMNADEIRDRLIALRWRIWRELGVGPSDDGVLRRRMIDLLIRYRITTPTQLQRHAAIESGRIARSQRRYLPEIFRIIRQMK